MNNATADALTLTNSPAATMTSREIAELTGKNHQHVLRDIDIMLTELGLSSSDGYLQNWTHPQNGQTYRIYYLPQDLTITLVSGYSVVMRHKIVTRWRELEAAAPVAIKAPGNLREALLLALN